jgi:hypothetical protein
MTMFMGAIDFEFLYLSKKKTRSVSLIINKKEMDKTKNFVVFFMLNFCYTPPPHFNNDCPQSLGEDLLSCQHHHLLDLLPLNLEVLEVLICQGEIS